MEKYQFQVENRYMYVSYAVYIPNNVRSPVLEAGIPDTIIIKLLFWKSEIQRKLATHFLELNIRCRPSFTIFANQIYKNISYYI